MAGTINSHSVQASADNYLDASSLNKITQLSRRDNQAALKEVAKQFESLFLQQMLKTMRDTNQIFAEDNPLNSNEMQFHQDMLDHQWVLNLASGKGIGLAEVFYRQMSPNYLKNTSKFQSIPAVKEADQSSILEKNRPTKFTGPDEFVMEIMPHAEAAASKLNISPDVLIAQAALETGWGKYLIKDKDGNSSFNLFNIKAGDSWTGKKVSVSTLEYEKGIAKKENANFRHYSSYTESFNDYVKLISENPRYEKAKQLVSDAAAYLEELQASGYATDPQYANKIKNILNSEALSQAKSFKEWIKPLTSLMSLSGLE